VKQRYGICIFVAVGSIIGLVGTEWVGTAQTPPQRTDVASALTEQLEKGQAKLAYEPKWGYLRSLLKALDVPIDSQILVFSRTSLQQDKIGPTTPRAIYFNDKIAVGSVQNGALFEIVASDANDGTLFFSLDTKPAEQPKIEHERSLCLLCHNAAWVPQTFVATVYPGVDGNPAFLSTNLFNATDHRSPFEDRWGGWYVTGTHGKMKHLGNAVARNPYRPVELETRHTQNLTSLVTKFDVTKYLTPTSDIVALMTYEHQSRAHYLMAALSAQFRAAGTGDPDRSTAKRPTTAALDAAVDDLVKYLTFADAAPLTSPIQGVSTFTQTFPQRGPRDSKNRSLRDFNLTTRLFEYPLSYVVYSDLFDKLEPRALERVYRGLYAELSKPANRPALEILRETKPNLPSYFRQ
jgi:hypothetical protein